MSCYHCGCAQVLHRFGREECESCSCIQYLDADGNPVKEAVSDDSENLITPDKFLRAGVRPGQDLWIRFKDEPRRTLRMRFDSWGATLPPGFWAMRDNDDSLLRIAWSEMMECRIMDPEKDRGMVEIVNPRDKPTNLDGPEAFLAARIAPGTRLHLAVVGNHVTDEAVFLKRLVIPPPAVAQDYMEDFFAGLVVRLGYREHELPWDDIIECWPVPEEIDPRYAEGRPPRDS